jgi:phosphatidylinositol alpha-1,6-mannosyltransferase
VVANSRFTRSEAVALGADPFKVTVLPVGAPDPVDVPAGDAEALRARLGGGRLLLSVGRLEPHKGQDSLVAALPELPGDVRLVLVGEGSARAEIERAARERGIADRVVFAGRVPEAELHTYYAAADAFAVVSRATSGERAGVEGGGIALLEAGAYGLPVVAGATGGVPETIRDSENGLLVKPDDHGSVVRALRRALEDTALARRLGDAARAFATGERSWSRFVDRMEDVLEAAARRSAEVS